MVKLVRFFPVFFAFFASFAVKIFNRKDREGFRKVRKGNATQNAPPPPPPNPPPEKPPPPPPPPNPEPDELDRGAETKTWFISEAMLCIELEKKMGLNPVIPLG